MPPPSRDDLRAQFWAYINRLRTWGLQQMDARWKAITTGITTTTSTDELVTRWETIRPTIERLYVTQAEATLTAADTWMNLTAATEGIPTNYLWTKDWTRRPTLAPSGAPITEALNAVSSGIIWIREHEHRSPQATMLRAEARLGTFLGTAPHQLARDITALRVAGLLTAPPDLTGYIPLEQDIPIGDTAAPGRRQYTTFDRWRRVTRPGACDFCLILATRGAIYRSRETALLTTSGFPYHQHCRCEAQLEINKEHRLIGRISYQDAARQVTIKTRSGTYSYDLSSGFDLRLVNEDWWAKTTGATNA